ncbi:MAG: dihydrofolate reductase [Nanoarchaeota archaeon]|nr:dihydrofolate reductase [Nanoarchaeota archaeon]MBU1004728.1 dihydrofolate reductase [Nanoarchaeota archaeon]MBU1945341.1 dihydrofolate reductase [Nanoarchaeota archaeon]
MTDIVVIVAIAQNGAIGKNNEIPWHIKEDFLHFKEKTMGCPVIMGDKTYDSLPANSRPLPGRENIVCTLLPDYKAEGATLFHDFNKAIEYVKGKGVEKAFVIGGATIYKLGMKVADVFELTRIYHDYDADAFYPEIDFSDWEEIAKDDHSGIDIKNKMNVKFSFITYKRKKQ